LNVRPIALLKSGVAYVPQGNRVFGDLTVRDNLEIGGASIVDRICEADAVERVLNLFPPLRHRLNQRAGTLSGGERQMLALANAFIISPRLLLIDEPSLGLATALVEEALKQICHVSSARGTGVLIVEQKIRKVIKIASRVLVIRNGEVSFDGPTAGLDEAQLQPAYP
jgi:branched-chain amino acid transport system ATP-binding protein